MSDGNRVFITGLGAITASGKTVTENWQALLAGQTSLAEIKQWDLSSWAHRLGGEINSAELVKSLPDRKLMKVISRQDVFGINAAMQAVEHSKLLEYREGLACTNTFNEKTAVYVGSPGNKYFQQDDFLPLLAKSGADMQCFAKELFNEVHPMWLLRILPNNVLAYTGITYNFRGPNHNITNHAVSGSQAFIEAYQAIKAGHAERAVVVAYDLIEPQGLFYYAKMGLLSTKYLKPFDKTHDGTLLADGAAAVVLESEASVQARFANCYGEIVAAKATTEAQGLFSIEADGSHLADLLTQTLATSALSSREIGMIVAHGNGNSKSDDSEARAIQAVFGQTQIPVTAFKWSMGHTICASGILDVVFTSYALKNRCVPGIANFNQASLASEGLNISAYARQLDVADHALIINRGFASMNACMVLKACD